MILLQPYPLSCVSLPPDPQTPTETITHIILQQTCVARVGTGLAPWSQEKRNILLLPDRSYSATDFTDVRALPLPPPPSPHRTHHPQSSLFLCLVLHRQTMLLSRPTAHCLIYVVDGGLMFCAHVCHALFFHQTPKFLWCTTAKGHRIADRNCNGSRLCSKQRA